MRPIASAARFREGPAPVASARSVVSKRRRFRHRGISWIGILIVLGIVTAIPVGAFFFVPWNTKETIGPLTHVVERGVFTFVVTEKGEVESSSNVEIRCTVKSKNSGGTAILEIVDEGTNVAKGDLLVRFDSSGLEDQLNLQQITVNGSNAVKIEAENVLDSAKIALEEYLQGTFKQEEQALENEIFVAEENLRRAEDYARFSAKLAAKGYVTELQLEGDRFAVDRTRKELEIGQNKLDILRRLTKKKMVGQFQSAILVAQAKLASATKIFELDVAKQELIQSQIEACTVYAPSPGQVVYANESSRRSDKDFIVEEGALLRENQVVIKLPDPKKMQVKAKINESRIDHVHEGQYVEIYFDAIPDTEVDGVVTKVDEYPLPGNWFSAGVREYGTSIQIVDPPPNLRPGMTAQVRIFVEQQQDVLKVPVQTVFEHGDHHYCLVKQGNRIEARQLPRIGMTNDIFLVVKQGLSENEEVLLHPRDYLDKVELPPVSTVVENEKVRDLPNLTKTSEAEVPRTTDEAASATNRSAARPPLTDGRSDDPAHLAGIMFKRFDKDEDGKLTREEMPEKGRSNFEKTDRNSDGFVDRGELIAGLNQRTQRERSGEGLGAGT